MWHRRRPLKATPPARVTGPVVGMMISGENFADKPFLGPSSGEMFPQPPSTPAPVVAAPLAIPPPPWQDALERGDLDLASLDPPAQSDELGPIDALRLHVEGFDPDPPAAMLGPPVVLEPLQRFQPPPVDWRREELERARQGSKPVELDEPAKSLQSRPA